MIDSPENRRDRLAADAEAYDNTLQPGSTVQESTLQGSDGNTDFEAGHPGLAKTVRLLNTVFRTPSGSESSSIIPPQPPLKQISRFRIERFLGSGGFGSVWLGHDPLLRRDVAIKVAHVGVHARADLQERFQREAHLAGRLHHPNIVPVFEADVDHDRLFTVSEYCPGQNLAEWLADHDGAVEPVMAAELVRRLADAADHAHRHGLIHRDIKPANVLLTSAAGVDDRSDDLSSLIPRLTDFGLARDLTVESSSTRTGMLIGTAEYMSPEQATGDVKAQGTATDIFSLGALLYRLLTGKTPFVGETDFETMQRIISAEPVAPRNHSVVIPRDLSSISLKCIEKRPDQRYATAADLRDDLDRFLRDEATVARPIRTVERIARWSRRAPAAAMLLCVSILSMATITAVMGFYLQQVNRHSVELAGALQETRAEREFATQARDAAESARIVAETQRGRADAQRELARESSYRSDMRLAFDLWDRRQIHQVKEILQRQQPGDAIDLRGPEWYVLDGEFRAEHREIGKHEGAVTESVITRDRRTLYTSGVDGYVRLWDLQTGELRSSFHPRIGEIHALALSPDESTIAVGGKPWLFDRSHVVLIDASTGQRLKNLQTHETTIESIAYSADGIWLAAGSRYEPVKLTRLSDGSEFVLAAGSRNRTVTFSSDSRFLTVTTKQSHVAWELNGEQPKRVHQFDDVDGRGRTPYLSTFSSQQPLLATTHVRDEAISLFRPSEPLLRAIAHRRSNDAAEYSCVSFSPDGSFLAAGDDSGQILVWYLEPEILLDAKENQATTRSMVPIIVSSPHRARVTSVVVTNEADVISSGEDGIVALTTRTAFGATQTKWPGIRVNAIALDGATLLLACEDGAVRQYDTDEATRITSMLDGSSRVVASTKIPAVMIPGSSAIRAIALSPNGNIVATGTVSGGVVLYQRQTGATIRWLVEERPDTNDVAVRGIAFSSDGRLLACTGEKGSVSVFDIKTGKKKFTQSVGTGWSVSFLPGDRFVACGGRFEGIYIFDCDKGTLSRSIAGDNTTSLATSPDGHSLASSHLNGTVQIIDTLPGLKARLIQGHLGLVEKVRFSSNHQSVVYLDKRNFIQFADVQTGAVFGGVQLPDGPPNSGDRFHSIQCSDMTLAVVISYRNGPVSALFLWRLNDAITTPDALIP